MKKRAFCGRKLVVEVDTVMVATGAAAENLLM